MPKYQYSSTISSTSVTGNVSEVSSYVVTKGFFLVAGMSGRSLLTLAGGFNDVAYASFIEYDFRV